MSHDLTAVLKQMEREDIAQNVARQAVERARHGVCVECGGTLDGGWSSNYCRLHSDQPLPLHGGGPPPAASIVMADTTAIGCTKVMGVRQA